MLLVLKLFSLFSLNIHLIVLLNILGLFVRWKCGCVLQIFSCGNILKTLYSGKEDIILDLYLQQDTFQIVINSLSEYLLFHQIYL